MTPDLYIAFGYCFLMLVLAVVYLKFPPKKINHLYGYRTPRSMKNETIWKAANDFSARSFVKISMVLFLLPIISLTIATTYIVLITLGGHLLLLGYSIFETEQYLTSHFDKNGDPQAQP